MRIDNEALLALVRCRHCEWCGAAPPSQAHHLFSRGAGRLDIPTNLVALCWRCHAKNHNGEEPDFHELIEVISAREGVPMHDIVDEVYRLRRLDKDADPGPILGEQAVPDDPLAG